MKKISLILILILLCAVAIRIFPHAKDTKSKIAPKSMSKSEVKLRSEMRVLWESRATLLRNYIVSATNDSKDADEARDKLLKNAGDLGASIRPYYGFFAPGMLTGLLKKDVLLTGEVIEAAKAGKTSDIDRARKKWYANALNVARFFAIPRNQTMKDLKDMFYKHLDLTWSEIEAILKKDKAKDLEYYEKDKAHMLMVSDVLVDGLVKQMPNRFKQ
jgi:hypothetical protein